MNTDKQFTPEENLKAVQTLMKFDGDIPLCTDTHTSIGARTFNQCDSIITEFNAINATMFYVSVDPPHANIEAYVICDGRGQVSYYDFTNDVVVVNDKISFASRQQLDKIEYVINEYKIEGGPQTVKPGVIEAYMAALIDLTQ